MDGDKNPSGPESSKAEHKLRTCGARTVGCRAGLGPLGGGGLKIQRHQPRAPAHLLRSVFLYRNLDRTISSLWLAKVTGPEPSCSSSASSASGNLGSWKPRSRARALLLVYSPSMASTSKAVRLVMYGLWFECNCTTWLGASRRMRSTSSFSPWSWREVGGRHGTERSSHTPNPPAVTCARVPPVTQPMVLMIRGASLL